MPGVVTSERIVLPHAWQFLPLIMEDLARWLMVQPPGTERGIAKLVRTKGVRWDPKPSWEGDWRWVFG
jgi:hypothetical protein